MGEMQPSVEAVYRSSRQGCLRYRLALEAAGIPSGIRRESGEFVIVVPASLAAQARTEIEAYAQENQVLGTGRATVREQGNGRAGVFAYAIVLALVFWLQNQGIHGAPWLDAGKADAGLILQGQWWRCVTALSLHSDLTHLVANIVFGGLIGLYVGQLLGSGLAWMSILLAGAVGNLFNAWVRDASHTSIGASTSVFAALGIVAAYASIRRWDPRKSRLARFAPVIGAAILLSYLGTSGERTDVFAHVSGFLAGLLLGAIYGKLGDRIMVGRRTQCMFGIGAATFLALAWIVALARYDP